MIRWTVLSGFWGLLVAVPVALSAQEGGMDDPRGTAAGMAHRVEVGPAIDGRLDDPVWQEAAPLEGFVQHEPLLGAPVSERTEVRILFDDEALYVGAWLHDQEPEGIIMGERRRDANLQQSDAFIVVFDTYDDEQNAFVFGTNPGGIEYDGQVRGGGSVNTNWSGSWEVATSRDPEGWYVEMRIPFSTLRYGPDEEQAWGLNMARYIGRKNEQAFWSFVPRQFGLYRLTEAGRLQGLEPPILRERTVTPYVLASAQRVPSISPDVEYPYDVGADAKIGITAGLTADFTVNTDFAQVEADEQQVDLTRFSLFFPERRAFFLENEDLFQVVRSRPGASPTPASLFHSRRIGIAGGQEVPIDWGARLTGRTGGTDIGLVHMRTGGLEGVQPSSHWSVARVARELPNRSSVGAMATSRFSAGDRDDRNRLYAVDARLGIGDAWTVDAVAAMVDDPRIDEGRELFLVTGDYRSEDWQVTAHYDRIGESFRPDVGFVRRTGYREAQIRVMRYLRVPQVDWIRELRPHTRYTVSRDPTGFKETEFVHLHTHVEFENGALTMPALDWSLDGLSEPFQIAGTDIVVPPGTYRGWTFWSSQWTNRAAPVSGNVRVETGTFLSGTRRGASAGVAARRGDTFAGNFDVNHNRIRLPEGEFDTTLTRLRLRWAFTADIAVQSLVQYSDQTGLWSGDLRFSWLNDAGTGLFVVYNERQAMEVQGIAGILPRDAVETPERTFTVKYTHRFDISRIAHGLGGS